MTIKYDIAFCAHYITPLAYVGGFGLTNDGYNRAIPDPRGAGLSRAIEISLENSRLSPRSVEVVYAHGSGTPVGDRAEAAAYRHVFGRVRSNRLITAIKPNVGHTMGPASAMSVWAACQTLQTGIVPPIANLKNPIADDLNFVMHSSVKANPRHSLVVGVGLGGPNTAVVLGKA